MEFLYGTVKQIFSALNNGMMKSGLRFNGVIGLL
jgi:hypothetical protein